MIILGIDPGFQVTGFAIIKKDTSNSVYLLDYGDLSMSPTKHLSVRIGIFFDFFTAKVEQWQITDIAFETPFLGKNTQNFLKLGYLRGIMYLIADQHRLTLHEFSPREVKQAVTGFGGASKDQVARVILQLFPRMQQPKKLDITDALAVTLCGLWRNRQLVASSYR
jgi:crossover junction endodeoxyribonuclease RuvC